MKNPSHKEGIFGLNPVTPYPLEPNIPGHYVPQNMPFFVQFFVQFEASQQLGSMGGIPKGDALNKQGGDG